MHKYIIGGLLVVVALLLIVIIRPGSLFEAQNLPPLDLGEPAEFNEITGSSTDSNITDPAPLDTARPTEFSIGQSAGGADIRAYTYGDGEQEILIIGGIHGGYSWNTAVLAYEIIDELQQNAVVLDGVRVTVIPTLNPDGLDEIFGTTERLSAADIRNLPVDTTAGRFNGNQVDLNRNFDCEWQASGTWQNQTVSGGTAAFSEPESAAIRDYISEYRPAAVMVYYSAAGGVYASSCRNGVSRETAALVDTYATAANYPAYQDFDYYEITGDMVNWLAKMNIPAISVLLSNHTDTEFEKNWAGVQAVINTYRDAE